ncbi:MAG: hypothetical protein ACREFO_08255 [Acetobacteraceae bacterium]
MASSSRWQTPGAHAFAVTLLFDPAATHRLAVMQHLQMALRKFAAE